MMLPGKLPRSIALRHALTRTGHPRISTTFFLVLVAAGFAAGCADSAPPMSPAQTLRAPSERAPAIFGPPARIGTDGEFLRLAEAVPGFGGYYYTGPGKVTVVLQDPTRASGAVDKLRRLARDRRFAEAATSIRRGDYEFSQLLMWKDSVTRHVLALPGVIFSDADEMRNRVVIGVKDEVVRLAVERTISKLGLPAAAVIIETAVPPKPAQTVRDQHRPNIGGILLSYLNPRNGQAGQCTLGFPAFHYVTSSSDTAHVYGITASHCTGGTDGMGREDGTLVYQNNLDGSLLVGQEFSDPPYTPTGGGGNFSKVCPTNRRCRLSDAALFRYESRSLARVGRIAKPTDYGTTSAGPITIDGADPVFRIFRAQEFPAAGTSLNKVGQTSGWTRGNVERTCIDIVYFDELDNDSGMTILCQYEVGGAATQGDSGAPVFGLESDNVHAVLYGILWGVSGTVPPGGVALRYYMSSMDDLSTDLGSLVGYYEGGF